MSRLGGKVVSLPSTRLKNKSSSKRCNSWVVDDWESENTPNKKQAKDLEQNCHLKRPKMKSLKKMNPCVSKSVIGQKSSTGRKKRDHGLHQLIFMPNGLPDGAELAYYASGKKLLEGYKMGDGIVCSCCDQKISPSVFEAHAGCATKRQPYRHIFTSDGVSLHSLSLSLKCSNQSLSSSPINRDQPSTQVDQSPALVNGGCAVSRTNDYNAKKSDDQTFLRCHQCEKEYCLSKQGISDLKEFPKAKCYCCEDCRRIHVALEDLISKGPTTIPTEGEENVQWQLLSGRIDAPEHDRSPLSKAAAIFRSCFMPIPESSTGRNMIPAMLYARNMGDMEFGGMYCAVLSFNSVVVSAAIIRILGTQVAEIPLVATTNASRGKGCCQALFYGIERFLCGLNVEKLVLPAAEHAISMWTDKFGFTKMTEDLLNAMDIPVTIFDGSTMLGRPLPKSTV